MTDYTASPTEVLREHSVSPNEGLPSAKARGLLEIHGENRLKNRKPRSLLLKFLAQMKDYTLIILFIAAIISFVTTLVGQSSDFAGSIIILAIVIAKAALGVRQESRAERALNELQDISAPTAKALRDGELVVVPSHELVPGDIVLLDVGDLIPADGRLIESEALKCDEFALTGESLLVAKDSHASISSDTPLADRACMVYAGCSVSCGCARLVVTATGMNTEMGKLAAVLGTEKPESTDIQQELNRLCRYFAIFALVACGIVVAAGLLQKMELTEIFITSASLVVAIVPKGMAVIVTTLLAVGARRMVSKSAVIRRLNAIEALGSTSVICSDKTGALTQNHMTVRFVWPVGHKVESTDGEISQPAAQVIRLGAMCNDGKIVEGDGAELHIGDPVETAIIAAARGCGLDKEALDIEFPRVAELAFDSDRGLMSTVHRVAERTIVVVKGGYDELIGRCTSADKNGADRVNLAMAERALHVTAVAYKELGELTGDTSPVSLEHGLIFIGLIGMLDPPREESKQAVALCKQAGIKTVMITEDNVHTAAAAAREIGILEEDGEAIGGWQLARMEDAELISNVERYRVYASVSPEDKIRIVRAWQSRGDVVAMTGAKASDAPALKAADIGCAMGIAGTDITKEAADMIIADDDFSAIVEAVRSGRGIHANIKKTIKLLLSSNLGATFAVLLAMLLGWGAPLMAVHLLLAVVVISIFPALALGAEPAENLMDKKPNPRGQSIFANGLWLAIALYGIMIGVSALAAYRLGMTMQISPLFEPSREIGITMAFLVLALSQLSNAISCRSSRSVFKLGLFSNPAMIRAVLISLAAVLIVGLVPPLGALFKLVTISVAHWLWVAGLSVAPLVIAEAAKLIKRG